MDRLEHTPSLHTLQVGRVPLEVPLNDEGVMQLGGPRRGSERGRLMVEVAANAIRLSREDGQLQIEDYDKPTGRPGPLGHGKVFEQPVNEVILDRLAGSEDAYQILGEGVQIADMARFKKLMAQVFIYVYQRQNPAAKAADIAAILDRDEVTETG